MVVSEGNRIARIMLDGRTLSIWHQVKQFDVRDRNTNAVKSYDRIYSTVQKIPRGKVATYGDIAKECGWVNRSRLVGYALHNLPPNSGVPWHRVINSMGAISISNLDGLADLQRRLLQKEGVRFVKGRIDFSRYGWVRRTNAKSLPPSVTGKRGRARRR